MTRTRVTMLQKHVLGPLRCPTVATRLTLVDNEALVRTGGRIESGVLGCECCAFPIVAGIPVMIADDTTRDAMHALEAGPHEEALFMLLGLYVPRAGAFRALLPRRPGGSHSAGLAILTRPPRAES